MAKMTIIDIDLGERVEEIISEGVKEITEQNIAEIEKAIDEKKHIVERKSAQLKQEQQVADTLEALYQLLLDAHKENRLVGIDELLEKAAPIITNNSALISRIKNYLRKQKGNEFVLVKRLRKRKPVYELNPFNTEQACEE